jgi:hypothetical protein
VNQYLLYCIFRSLGRHESGDLHGVDGQPVVVVSNNGLSAAISKIARSNLTLDISGILAYKKVIDTFHRDRAVIPMRYGCLLEEELQVLRLLEGRSSQYEALLQELGGCVEMGIRILISGLEFRPPARRGLCPGRISDSAIPAAQFTIHDPQSGSPGKTYLTNRRTCYAEDDRRGKEIQRIFSLCRKAFAGLFVKCKTEYPPGHIQCSSFFFSLPSLHFLVPRRHIEPFGKIFRHTHFWGSAKLLLSGPWPPYSFVIGDDSENEENTLTAEREKKDGRQAAKSGIC